jgi:predicted anti-sigma-YlaC factor YlaD
LTDYLDEKIEGDGKTQLEKHMAECPNCWVIFDTTRKTIEIYKGHERQCCVPSDVQERLVAAMERKLAAKSH